jgi:hypothetical protein
MATELENNPVQVIYSSLSSNLTDPPEFEVVLERSLAATCDGGGSTTVFEMILTDDGVSGNTYVLTVTPVQETAASSLEDTLERCETFIRNSKNNSQSSMTALVEQDYDGKDASAISQRACLMVLSKLERNTSEENVLPSSELRQSAGGVPSKMVAAADTRVPNGSRFWYDWGFQWQKPHTYESLPRTEAATNSKPPYRRHFGMTSILVFAFVLIVFLSSVAIWRGIRDNTYIRYDTSGSSGPRYQLRIYWQNASEWARANPQDSGKWKVRLDDQAIIPADLYDEDEDRYQEWYRNRYPEVQQVVENLNYLRPAWLGSLDMMVPWDNQFHFAHCVLALRRYWKAKESGKHVCGRDIDHAHINHCLEALEDRVFIEGPRVEMDPPQYLYWQTRVCF